MFPERGVDFGRMHYTALHDQRIAALLERTDADAVIATRPILNGYLARHGQQRCLRIGQEHLSFDAHSDQLREDQNSAMAAGLDAFVTVSEADAGLYRAALPDVRAEVLCIPNGVPAPAVEQAPPDSKVIVAAGRLVAVKRYDQLIDAFAKVAAEHPDWTLRIYGRGPAKSALRRQIDELGLYDRVFLMGAVSPIETEWAKGSIAAVSSDMESFGMTIVESMHCGVPVTATDCPHGPAEIISHGEDGLLVPLDGGADAYAGALTTLITDQELRLRLGHAARAKAGTYAPSAIGRRYEQLFHELSRKQNRRGQDESPAPGKTSLLSRLRASLGKARPSSRPASAADPAEEPAGDAEPPLIQSVTSVRATADGGLSVRLDSASLPSGPLDFVARLRKDPARREIRVPVSSAASTSGHSGVDIAVERQEHRLAEGRWDCYIAPRGTNRRRRLVARLVEQARLVTLPPVVGKDGLSAWIPYRTTDGFLAVRTWQRPAHAEVDHTFIGADSATVTATVLGGAELPAEGATVNASCREGRAYDFAMPARFLGDGRFQFTVPYGEALARRSVEHDLWDLRLLTTATAEPVPVGRVTGDIVERKKTDACPALEMVHPERGATRVKPFFTVTNDLALSVRDARG
ncbi:glycosyltransferase [Streptomyces sp. E11-3]|uniref:glycosyltransferase n=1 Tax=Streptomyces sp. E11-3 TaxID=3110112 RepID=UPI0039807634